MAKIEKVKNGYIVDLDGKVEVQPDLLNVLQRLLSYFEGRSDHFSGDLYGRVMIDRGETFNIIRGSVNE